MITNDAVTMTDSASVDFEMPAPGMPGYEEFRKTGKLPEVEESAPQEKVEPEKIEVETEHEPEQEAEAAAAKEPAEIAAESATAPTQRGKKDAAARLQEVLAERKKDRELIRQLTEKLTGPSRETPHSQAATEPEKPAAKAEATPKPKIDDLDAQGKPKFKTYGDYEDARDEWNRQELLRVFEEKQTKTQQTQQAAEAEKVIAQKFTEKVAGARTKYADFDAVALNPELPIRKGSVADQFIIESPNGPDVLYHLGQNPDVLDHILTLNPIAQARELFKIEQTFAAPAPKPAAPKPPARTITQAPPPPRQVTGKGPSPDPVEQAVKDGDQAAFTRAENEKALARWKAGRR